MHQTNAIFYTFNGIWVKLKCDFSAQRKIASGHKD